MANVLAPFGFSPCGDNGAPVSYRLTELRLAYNNSHNIFRGDWCIQLNTGYIDVGAASDGAIGAGVFWGCEYYNTQFKQPVWSPYWPASASTPTNGIVKAYVITDPAAQFLVQSAGTVGALPFTAVGQNIDISTTTAGNTANGISGMTIDDNTVGTSNALPFHVIALYDGTGKYASNAVPGTNGSDTATAYNYAIVSINAAILKAGQTGV